MQLDISRFQPHLHPVTALTDLIHRAYAPLAAQGLRFVATWQGDEITLKRAAGGECYVALQDELLVGTVVFYPPDRLAGCGWYDRSDVAGFGQFAVDPDLQGAGIGGRLLRLCEERAGQTGAVELACDTAEPAEHLIRFYQKRGYRPVEIVKWDATNYRSVILTKQVSP